MELKIKCPDCHCEMEYVHSYHKMDGDARYIYHCYQSHDYGCGAAWQISNTSEGLVIERYFIG